MDQPRYWIGVASKDHVLKGVEGGFCQLCHGKSNPLKRLSQGDWIIYYSPRNRINNEDLVQSFTAIGRILEGEPYTFDMGNDFVPFRRNVQFLPSQEAPIRPMIDNLSFIFPPQEDLGFADGMNCGQYFNSIHLLERKGVVNTIITVC